MPRPKKPWLVERRHGVTVQHIQEAPASTYQEAFEIAQKWADLHNDTYWIRIQYWIPEIREWVEVRFWESIIDRKDLKKSRSW